MCWERCACHCSDVCLQAASGLATELMLHVKHAARLLQQSHVCQMTVLC